jgi:hypothetical protein
MMFDVFLGLNAKEVVFLFCSRVNGKALLSLVRERKGTAPLVRERERHCSLG